MERTCELIRQAKEGNKKAQEILVEENKDLQESWLVLTNIVYKTNLLLLDTLGLKVPEKM